MRRISAKRLEWRENDDRTMALSNPDRDGDSPDGQFLQSPRGVAGWNLDCTGYALFLESYRIWMQSLRKGQPWITGGSLVLIALVVFSHFTLERFLLLIALGVPMIRLTRSLRQYSLALDHFKQRLAEENEDSSTTGKC